jgi:hypothetical protein
MTDDYQPEEQPILLLRDTRHILYAKYLLCRVSQKKHNPKKKSNPKKMKKKNNPMKKNVDSRHTVRHNT